MFVGSLGIGRQFLLAVLLALLQLLVLGSRLFLGERLLEDGIVQEEEVVLVGRTCEHHALLVVGRGVHLRLCPCGQTHLVLQNGTSRLAAADGMKPVVGRA